MNQLLSFLFTALRGITQNRVIGRKSAGTGRAELLDGTDLRSIAGVYSTAEVDLALSGKQATLVSGENLKTVNSTSLLGSGDLAISASPAGSSGQVQVNSAGAFGAATAVVYAASGTHLTVTAQSASDVPICAKGTTAQTGNLFEARNVANAMRGQFTKDGMLVVTFDTAVISNGIQVVGSNGVTYATIGFSGLYGQGSWVGMDVYGSIGRVNIGAGQMHITHASGNRSRLLTYGNLELSPGNLGGGGTYVEINNGTAGTYRDLLVRSVTQSSGSNLAGITKAALLLLTPNAATGGRWRVTDATPANREAYPTGSDWRYSSDDTVVT